jgi:hypothetical protein
MPSVFHKGMHEHLTLDFFVFSYYQGLGFRWASLVASTKLRAVGVGKLVKFPSCSLHILPNQGLGFEPPPCNQKMFPSHHKRAYRACNVQWRNLSEAQFRISA